MKSMLDRAPGVALVVTVQPPCNRAARKELKNLPLEGCDRAVLAMWCKLSSMDLGRSRILPKSINRNLIEFVDLSLLASKNAEERGRIAPLVRAIRIAASKLLLAEPLKDRELKFASNQVAVLGSDSRAISAAKRLASLGLQTKLLLSGHFAELENGQNLETLDEVMPIALSGYPGDFKITVIQKGKKLEVGAAALLLVSERCRVEVEVPSNAKYEFLSLERFDEFTSRKSETKGIVFLDDLQSLSPSADPVIPNWPRLLESAKRTAADRLAKSVTVIARDIKSTGLLELLWKEAAEAGVNFVRYDDKSRPRLARADASISVKDLVLGEDIAVPAEVIVAPTISRPWEPIFVENMFLPADWDLRLRMRGPQRGTGQSPSEGVFLLGYADFNALSDELEPELGSVLIDILSFMRGGIHLVRGAIAEVDEEKCSACFTCVRTCPYRAPIMNDNWKAEIITEKCVGCGCCVAVCPSRAIKLKNCTDAQIQAQVSASLEEVIS